MADEVEITQSCGVCHAELGSLSVKKENMMLTTSDRIWCSRCQAEQPEIREVAGRHAAMVAEETTLPRVDDS